MSLPLSKLRDATGGRLIYAVGDVHGRADLLAPLLEQIRSDALASARAAKPILVFIGDYVDRGPSSRAVIDRVISVKQEAFFEVCALKGNHEAALLAFLDDPATGPTWCELGGRQTLTSYGVSLPALPDDVQAWREARDAFALALPREHRNFLTGLQLSATYGGYVFVHAGLRPGVPLAEQSDEDLLWIRHDFLAATGPFGGVVVHGHTPVELASMDGPRINLDTGAFATGVLTAVRLEGDERRFMQVGGPATVAQERLGKRPASAPVRQPSLGWPVEHGLNIATLVLSVALFSLVAVLFRGAGVGGSSPAPVASIARPFAAQQAPAPDVAVSSVEQVPPLARRAGDARVVVAQVGAFGSGERARSYWRELSVAMPDVAEGKTLSVEADPGRVHPLYRVAVGGFESGTDAARFCAALRAAARPCFLRSAD